MNIRHVHPITGPEELGEVPLEQRNGRALRLADVGQVREDHQPLQGEPSSTRSTASC